VSKDRGFTFTLKIDYLDDLENPLLTMSKDELKKLSMSTLNPTGPLWRASVSSVKDSGGRELLNQFVLEWDRDKAHGGLIAMIDDLKVMVPRVLKANGVPYNG
jgi:hypothetical protein